MMKLISKLLWICLAVVVMMLVVGGGGEGGVAVVVVEEFPWFSVVAAVDFARVPESDPGSNRPSMVSGRPPWRRWCRGGGVVVVVVVGGGGGR